jgi:flagellar motor switch protein FliM
MSRSGLQLLIKTRNKADDRVPPAISKLATDVSRMLEGVFNLPSRATADEWRLIGARQIREMNEGRFAVGFVRSHEDRVFTVFPDEFILDLIEVALGGGPPMTPHRRGGELTRLELAFARAMLNVVAECLDAHGAFKARSEKDNQVVARMDRLAEELPDTAFMAGVTIDCLGRSGRFHVLFPESVARAFAADPTSDAPAMDENPAASIAATLAEAEVVVSAVIDERMKLRDVMEWRVGQTVEIEWTRSSPVVLKVEGDPVRDAELGQREGVYTVKVLGGGSCPRREEAGEARGSTARTSN